MKKILLLLIFLMIFSNSIGQCLCGKLEIQICFNDLSFLNGKSNYELNFLEKPESFHYNSGILKETAFLQDTLKIILPTDAGIQKLVIQIKNINTKSTMDLTITNMTYDNNYFIDVGNYVKGNYIFNWKKINKCQSENKTTKIVNCDGMKFKQLILLSQKPINGDFNHNKIEVIKLNSFLQDNPLYDKNLKDKVFKLWSEVFTINGIDCRWEYEVKYTDDTNENTREPLVNLISQKLITWRTKELLLNLDLSKFIYLPPKSIAELEYNKYPDSSIDNLKDVNSDNYTDIQFMTEHAGAGANIAYTTYLFNSKKNKFEYSELFSGYNIQYDSIKNRISSVSRGGWKDLYYIFKNLKDNKKEIEFVEKLRHHIDTIYYQKLINEKIIIKKKIVLGEYENWEKFLERN